MRPAIIAVALMCFIGEITGQSNQPSTYQNQQVTERTDDVSCIFKIHAIPKPSEAKSIRKTVSVSTDRGLHLYLDSIIRLPTTSLSGSKFIYGYDSSGNVIAIEEYTMHHQIGVWVGRNRYFYTYDNIGRLICSIRQSWLNTSPQQWGNVGKEEWVFDTLGNIKEHIEYAGNQNQWTQYSKEKFTYDANGYTIEYRNQKWDSNQWIDNYRWIIDPDSLGRPTSVIVSQYKITGWTDLYKLEREYSTVNELQKEIRINYDSVNNQWNNASKQEYMYNPSGLISDYYQTYWVNGTWNNNFHKKYTYNAQNQLFDYLEATYKNQIAQNYRHLVYDYDSMNRLIQYREEDWDTTNSLWVGRIKIDHTYDNPGNRISYVRYNWKNGQWTPGIKGDLKYDTTVVFSDLVLPNEPFPTVSSYLIPECYETEWINKLEQFTEYNWSQNQWNAGSAAVYYYSNPNISIQETSPAKNILIYPNPTNGIIYFAYSREYPLGEFELFNSEGRKLHHVAIQPDGFLDLSDIPSGFYIYRYVSEKYTQSGKIIKN